MFKNYNHYVGYNSDDLVFGYTKRTNGLSDYPKNAFNMALYIGDDPDNVYSHQQLLSEEIGFERSDFVIPIQTHENKVYEVKKADAGTNVDALTDNIYGIDALYTYERNIVLGMNYADCTPIYVYSVANSFLGLAHAGWKGTRGNVLKNLLDHYDGDIDDLRVVIGVAINGDYYEVDDAVVNDSFLVAKEAVTPLGNDKFLLDLKTANKHQALDYGIKESNIHVTPIGTESEEFFSYRLDDQPTGRALGFIGRRL